MIATVKARDEHMPCVVRWTGRRGLSVRSITYCEIDVPAGEGVSQIPESADICPLCAEAIQRLPK